jgi:hypothetical protein
MRGFKGGFKNIQQSLGMLRLSGSSSVNLRQGRPRTPGVQLTTHCQNVYGSHDRQCATLGQLPDLFSREAEYNSLSLKR